MALETRIGVVTGLVIVVIASVYFFYGNSSDDTDLFLVQNTRVAAPAVEIPASVEKRPPVSLVDRVLIPPKQGAPQSATRTEHQPPPIDVHSPPAVAVHSPPAVAVHSPPAVAVQSPPGVAVPSPPGVAVPSPPADQRMPAPAHPRVASADGRAARGELPQRTAAPVLRTAPSDELVEATWDNLARHTGKPASGATTGGTTPQPPPGTATRPPPKQPAAPAPNVKHRPAVDSGSDDKPRPAVNSALNDKPKPAVNSALNDKPRPAVRTDTYVVRDGDSFYSIASEVLGDPRQWRELFRINKDLVRGDPKRLRPGMILKLPR